MASFWDELRAHVPGVRTMTLVIPAGRNCISDFWHHRVPQKLSGSSLAALRVILYIDFSQPSQLQVASYPITPDARSEERARNMARRRKILNAFLKKLFKALPALTIVAIADTGGPVPTCGTWKQHRPCMDYDSSTDKPRDKYLVTCGRGAVTRRRPWDELDRTQTQFQWWCRGKHAGRPVRVSEEDGERIHTLAESAEIQPGGASSAMEEVQRLIASLNLNLG
ncbi:hypothetical protein BN946_scf184939.g12 [Trametes cinnabarina]|uniref:Uncharacterized protein n=1 Tax=Pycnoporus cinnabarinus TaxID=5643 RepID=A0A060SHC3_PYCCI|nr:hypothetical protein BN946_scf184939.g12 [Trametes cinnabarina]